MCFHARHATPSRRRLLRRRQAPPMPPLALLSVTTPKGPLFAEIARLKGPGGRQPHGATVAGEEGGIASVMGPGARQGDGARRAGVWL